LLDEPTSALDRGSIQLFIRHLSELSNRGVAILLSTHDPSLKDGLADRVYFLNNGVLSAG